jgi:Ca2+-binding EF-hand superfamily protein
MVIKVRYILSLSLIGLTLTGLSLSSFAEESQFQQRMLERMDDNEDGVISMEEFQPPMEGRMSHADTDGDGAVTLAELNQHRAERMADKEAQRVDRQTEAATKMAERFQAMDSDGSGSVTPEEARLAAFNHMDRNQDGNLSVEELHRPEGRKRRAAKAKHRNY